MKIFIVTAYFYPIPCPRSFRATELALEFAKRGHEVVVYNATTSIGFDYVKYESENCIKIINLDIMNDRVSDSKSKVIKSKLMLKLFLYIRIVLFYFTSGRLLTMALGLKRKLVFYDECDLLLSIGLPFQIHWAVARIAKKHKIADCYVADYGDPFSKNNSNIKVAKYFQYIEKNSISEFDYISVPTSKVVNDYLWLKDKSKIKVIPQGFDLSNIELNKYIPNEVPVFGYAGLFYSDIRNPKSFFEYLCGLDVDFVFIIYTNINNADSFSCIEPYIDRLGSKLVINDLVGRNELIYQFSSIDFIININNTTKNQIPSKLIDYALTKRPIFSLDQVHFNVKVFELFMVGNYSGKEDIDISENDIVCVVDKYLDLHKSKISN